MSGKELGHLADLLLVHCAIFFLQVLQAGGKKTPLPQLLAICCDYRHAEFDAKWREFGSRYDELIVGRIRHSLVRWKRHNDPALVGDVLSNVRYKLIAKDFKALREFEKRDDEQSFISFLSRVCHNATVSFMLSETRHDLVDIDEQTFQAEPSEDPEAFFRFVSQSLFKSVAGRQSHSYNTQRDILIFLLRQVASFRAKEMAQIPILGGPDGGIKPGNIDNIVNRLGETLKTDGYMKKYFEMERKRFLRLSSDRNKSRDKHLLVHLMTECGGLKKEEIARMPLLGMDESEIQAVIDMVKDQKNRNT